MKPRLLVVAGTFLAVSGGAEISALSLLRRLRPYWDITVLTCNFRGARHEQSHYGLAVHSVPYLELEAECNRLVTTNPPRLIYTVMLGSDTAMKVGARHRIPTIVNVCKAPVGPRYLSTNPPTRVLAVSDFVQEYLRFRHGVTATVVNPIVEFDSPPLAPRPRFVTIFNPVKAKGGFLFRDLAARLPQHEFAWVPGWDILRSNGKFDPTICAEIARSIDIPFSGGTPEDVSFDQSNIHRLKPVFPPHPIYQETRILVVPSQWDEAFGRVAAEGMLFDIPVLGSEVGGLGELSKSGGVCLPKDDVDAWETEIRKLDDAVYYRMVQERGAAWRSRWLRRNYDSVISVFNGFI